MFRYIRLRETGSRHGCTSDFEYYGHSRKDIRYIYSDTIPSTLDTGEWVISLNLTQSLVHAIFTDLK